VELDELAAGLGPQLRVEVRQRLVHEERERLAHHGPAERDALALTAREGRGVPVEQLLEAEDPGDAVDPLGDARALLDAAAREPVDDRNVLPPRQVLHDEREAHVPADRHVRVQGIALEHESQVAVAGLEVLRLLAVDPDDPRAERLQARDHPQQGRLAASGGSEEHEEVAVLDLEAHVVDRGEVAERAGHMLQRDLRDRARARGLVGLAQLLRLIHFLTPSQSPRRAR
jgi:hypothetical protein